VRLANVSGRATIVAESGDMGFDVAAQSAGAFGPSMTDVFDKWTAFRGWAESAVLVNPRRVERTLLESPSPEPSQVFAIGLNYREHVREVGLSDDDYLASSRVPVPPTFTKFASSLAGPFGDLVLPSDKVDWEVELVVVIGKTACEVTESDAWDCVAGVAVGQDYSERQVQLTGDYPQFSLGKSFRGFGPIGPWLVTPDELSALENLELTCEINGEVVQRGRTTQMIWNIPELVATLSNICTLRPGDIIFTGTPAGVGSQQYPPRYLKSGDIVTSSISGVGHIEQRCLGPSPARASTHITGTANSDGPEGSSQIAATIR
jgi:2,4-didehydro-3-deoxy-L-rhamnonate hydrolase